MNGWLLDASVLFELRRANPDPNVAAWSDEQPRESLFLSEATIATVRHRGERRGSPELRTEIGIWLDQSLRPWFAGRILPVTEEILLESMRLRKQHGATAAGVGHPITSSQPPPAFTPSPSAPVTSAPTSISAPPPSAPRNTSPIRLDPPASSP